MFDVALAMLAALTIGWSARASRISPVTLVANAAATMDGVPANCGAGPGADAYLALAQRRQDVLRLYAQNGWDPATKCRQIYDDWLAHGPDGQSPTTAAAFVAAQDWLPATVTPSARTS